VISVELEAKRREHLDKVPVISSHVTWVQQVSKAGAALAGQLLPETLQAQFSLLLVGSSSCRTVSVQQLNVEIISSQIVYDDLLGPVASSPGRKGYKGSTVVTRTELDPLTGTVTESQTMRLPVLPDYLPELLPDFPGVDRPQGQDAGSDSSQGQGQGQIPGTVPDATGSPEQQEPPQQKCTESCGLPNTDSSACVEGICRVVACAPGWEDCDGNPVNGCEANVLGFFSDDNHCGSCNKVCLSPLSCQLGKCAAKPPPGLIPSVEDPSMGFTPFEPEPQQQPKPQQPQQQEPSGEGDTTKPGSGVKPAEPEEPSKPAEPAPGKEEPQVGARCLMVNNCI
jgi:hypothetical protein